MRYALYITSLILLLSSLIVSSYGAGYRNGKRDGQRNRDRNRVYEEALVIDPGTNSRITPAGFNGDHVIIFCPYYFNLIVKNESRGIDGIVVDCKNPDPAALPWPERSGK